MAKNDYHVIVYRILLYLYTCLKGEGERYWHYILCSLLDYGFISGAIRIEVDNTFDRVYGLDGLHHASRRRVPDRQLLHG